METQTTPFPVPPGGTLLGVWAHPDDECYLSAALMARTVRRGGRVVVAYATKGEAGTDDPIRWPPCVLAHRREAELRASLAIVGADAPLFMGYHDGACDGVDAAEATERIEALIDQIGPDAIVTFGSDGATGHPDHRAVSAWTTAAWRSVRTRRLRSPALLMSALSPAWVSRNARLHEELGLFYDADLPRVTTPGRLSLHIELTERELDMKRAALAAHASQTDSYAARMGEQAYRRWWDVESFRGPDSAELAGHAPPHRQIAA